MKRAEYINQMYRLQSELSMAADGLEAELANLHDGQAIDTDTLYSVRCRIDDARTRLNTLNAHARSVKD